MFPTIRNLNLLLSSNRALRASGCAFGSVFQHHLVHFFSHTFMTKVITAAKAAPTARTAEETASSTEPIWKDQFGRVQGAMWRHEQVDEETNQVRIRYTVAISRSYKDKDGDWQSVHYFDLDDLKNVHRIADEAETEVNRIRKAAVDEIES